MARVLLVEDNECNSDILTRRLARRGYDIVVAVDGRQAIDLAILEQPDVILMDMSLPVMDGWQATRLLRQHPATCHIPVIGLSAHAMQSDHDRAIAAGCHDYETKPVDFTRLLAKLARYCGAMESA